MRHVQNDAGRTALDNVTRADPDRVWTVREVVEHVGIGGAGPVVVGTPEKVADDIEAWFEQTDVDGLNVAFATSPGDFEDIADMLVPELTKRGRYKSAYAKGTLREKLFGAGRARLSGSTSGGKVSAACSSRAAEEVVGWAKRRSDVPTIHHRARCDMVGTLRFAHPARMSSLRSRSQINSPNCSRQLRSALRRDG